MTNENAKGNQGKRYSKDCEFVDGAEPLAIEHPKRLFDAPRANVQAHSGSRVDLRPCIVLNQAVETVLAMSLAQGGHLTQGDRWISPANCTKSWDTVWSKKETLDHKENSQLAQKNCPRLIVAGASTHPPAINFAKIVEIARAVRALFMVNMAHIVGLVATTLHPDPFAGPMQGSHPSGV